MRKLMFAAIGFTAALTAAHYLIPFELILYFAGGAAVISALGFLFRSKARMVILITFIACAFGFIWCFAHEAVFIRPTEELIGKTLVVEARVIDTPKNGDGYSSVTLKLTEDSLPGCKVLVSDYNDVLGNVCTGDILEIELEFRSARVRYGVEDDYYLSSGIFLRAYTGESCIIVGHRAAEIFDFPKVAAAKLKDHILALFPEDVAPLMKALLTGDKSEFYQDDSLYVAMKLAGLSHIIAVSGMHVSFIISLISVFTGRRRITAFLGLPLVWFFAAMTGFSPSVTRASLMISLMLIAPILRRENDSPTSLSAALLIILLINPQAIGSISLQLSFAAMAGIIMVTPRIYKAAAKLYSGKGKLLFTALKCINGVIASSIGALVFTTPLAALHFGYIPLYSVISNLLCLWVMSIAFMASYPICLIGALYFPLGEALAWLVAWLPRYTIFAVKLIARLPWAALYTSSNLAAWWLIFAYLVLITPWFFRGGRGYRPIIPICCCLITLPIVLYISSSVIDKGPSVSAIDVGQGQCIAALADNATVLIDCGGRGSAENAGDCAAEFLLSRGRREVDLMILTHLHDDHANGVIRLMSYMDVKRIVLPEECEATENGDSIIELCYDNNTEIYYISENTLMRVDELALDIFAPIGSEDPNEKGILVLGDYGDFEFLVTGDAGSGTEKQLVSFYPIGDIDLLVAGHHGSKYSTSDELLDSMRPETAFISVGMNSYGHPTDEVLQRLYSRGIDVYRTDKNGNITIMAGNSHG